MYAVEFEASVNNGTIKVPEKFIKKIGNKVKVIILNNEEQVDIDENNIKKFNNLPESMVNPVIIEDFTFYTREQLNER